MEVQLTVRYPDNTTTTHRFREEPITVGSAVANHIVLTGQDVAPHQLIFFREGGGWVARNLAPEPAVLCEDRPLTAGETRVLGHEAGLVLGPFVVEWCADAPPIGEAKELARPAAVPAGAAAAVPAAVHARGTPEPAAERVIEAADLDSAFDRLDAGPGAAAGPGRPAPRVAAGVALADPPPARAAASDRRPSRAVMEPPVTPAPPAVFNPRITLNTFRRMYPFRAYPLLVNITQPAASSEQEPDSVFVRVVPSLPGCLVTPPAARLDLRRAAVGMRFWVTPMVVGRQRDGWIDVAWQGAPPARLKMVFRVVRQWPAKLLAALAVLVATVAHLAERFPELLPPGLEEKTPQIVRDTVAQAQAAMGSATYLGLAGAGALLVLAALAFLARRPKSTALTASRPRL